MTFFYVAIVSLPNSALAQHYGQFTYRWPNIRLTDHQAVIQAISSGRMMINDVRLRSRACVMAGAALQTNARGSRSQRVYNFTVGVSTLFNQDKQQKILPGTPCFYRDERGKWRPFGIAIRALSYQSPQMRAGRWTAGGTLKVTLADNSQFVGRVNQSRISVRRGRGSGRLRAVLTNANNRQDPRFLVITEGSFGLRLSLSP